LPLADSAAALILSVDARRNPAECARVLAPGGRLLIAVPADDDQAELRAAALGAAAGGGRAAKLVSEHAPLFTVAARRDVRERRRITGDLLDDLLLATYRGGRAGRRERVAGVSALDVTLSHEIVLFARN
jgi:SAM-dependent methyltransferase